MENNNTATIHIRRSSHFVGAALSFKVFINDIEVGRIKRKGQDMSFSVQSGKNLVQIKTLFRKSNSLTVEVTPDETITLDCGIDSTGFYLKDPDSKSSTGEQNVVENFDRWIWKRWYVVLLCVLIGSGLMGALFPGGIYIGGLRLTAAVGMALGFLVSYLIYKAQSSQ